MNRSTNTAVTIAATALLLGGLVGCGGSDSDGGSDASGSKADSGTVSQDDFCTKFNDLYTQLVAADPEDTSAAVKGMKDWAGDMEDLGTPEDMPDDVRDGFDVVISTIKDVDDDASVEDLSNLDSELSEADNKSAETFSDWTQDNCDDPELPTPSPSAS
ncbi:hypothetical protein [Nocardioides conyzicola]|uniref:Uncharacterized protein n=1 Tax=Nocardioides conyzicola TaxID=1651781 RepID=A0ABP8XEL3_9ACTN